jgi:ADP-heptose:LPS heptosyltransferase
MNKAPPKILVVRNDKLGDFMLTWPTFATLKQAMPCSEIHALVAPYTADMARLCPNIDNVILDPGDNGSRASKQALTRNIKTQGYDASITLFSTNRIGLTLMLARIPYRLAPATKIAQLFYTKRLKQRRSRSQKPEWAYNQDLALHYLSDQGVEAAATPGAPFLSFEQGLLATVKQDFCRKHDIDINKRLLFIHPGSGGSANNLNLQQYAEIGTSLTSSSGHHIVVSAGPGEFDYAEQLGSLLDNTPHIVYRSEEGLVSFSQHIAIADLFISGSTGPLHIAGALNCNTAAFYPRRRSATALRWQTINQAERRLAFSPPEEAEAEDMSSIDVLEVAKQISEKFLLA